MVSLNTQHLLGLIFLCLSVLLYKPFFLPINLQELCELENKPFIFGEEACDWIVDGSIQIQGNILTKLIASLGHKPVIYGTLNNSDVVLKKLASTNDAKDFLETIDSWENKEELLTDVSVIKKLILDTLSDTTAKLYLCPETKSVDKFLARISEKLVNNTELLINFWTSLCLNPEPVILKILTPPSWPIPKYYGTCGILGIVENGGAMLTDYYNEPWILRANISYQLLNAAFKLTFSDPEYAFYLTDISSDNIGVDSEGVVRFIDLEHVIVLEREAGTWPEWTANHTSDHVDCSNCFSFSVEEICQHRVSDHNIYGICKEIFSPSYILPEGFLHSMPKEVEKPMKQLISECVDSSGDRGRFETALVLKEFLYQTIS